MKNRISFILAVLAALIIHGLFFVPIGLFAKEPALAFPDVPKEHPFAQTIEVLKQKGFVKGYPDGTFSPDTTVSRAEFITIIMASTGENLSGENCFKDIGSEWFAKFVCSAKKKGFINGYSDGTFKPANNINLAEASAVLAKAYKLNPLKPAKGEPWYKPAIKKLETKKAIPVSIDYLDKKISRAETGEIILRLKDKIETKPTKTFAALASEIPQISSCAELKEKFNIGYYKQNLGRGVEKMIMMEMAMPAPPSGVPSTASPGTDSAQSESSLDYSATNVQVEGVDEADIIKNDGEFIYMVSGNVVRIIKAFPPEKLNEIAKLEVSDESFSPSEIYVSGNKLVVLGATSSTDTKFGYYNPRSKVYIFDISDKTAIKEVRNIEMDGWTVSSRKIGSRLYLVVNKTPNFYTILKNDTETQKLLPVFRDSVVGEDQPVSACSDIRFIPQYEQPNFLTVAGINIDDVNESVKREVIMGAGDTVYASLNSLYVASRRYEYPVVGAFKIWGGPQFNYDQKTALFRFNLDGGDVKFATKGEVKGTLLNQFSMDESGDAFRIATTTGEVWNQQTPSKNHLFILDKNDLSKVLGKISDIAPGEKIYSVRFLGSRAYMVTFKKIDPFFVIDVSNDAAPKILGALKIPGFSDYLHPFDENHIIGFGKEAVDPVEIKNAGLGGMGFDFAWYQGMKIALFDVTDVANPKVLFKEVIGDRGTNSELLNNHKALLYDKVRNLFAFPVEVYEIKNKQEDIQDPGSQYGEPVFQGAYVYNLDLGKGFQLKGKITHFDNFEEAQKKGLYSFGDYIKRITYIGDFLYTISDGRIKSVARDTMEEKAVLKLDVPEPQFKFLPD